MEAMMFTEDKLDAILDRHTKRFLVKISNIVKDTIAECCKEIIRESNKDRKETNHD
jgi:hypothetical protein